MTPACPDKTRRAVLVVEDNPAVREALGLIPEDGYQVIFADDGPPAVERVRTQPPDLVLLDLGLPTMDGFEVLAEIKRIAPPLPVVVVTITSKTQAIVRAGT